MAQTVHTNTRKHLVALIFISEILNDFFYYVQICLFVFSFIFCVCIATKQIIFCERDGDDDEVGTENAAAAAAVDVATAATNCYAANEFSYILLLNASIKLHIIYIHSIEIIARFY